MIQAARRLYVTPGQHLTLGQVVELNKRFLEAYVLFKDELRVQELRKDVLKYNRILRDLGLRDHQVPGSRKAGWRTFGLLCYRALLLAIWTTFALPGVILNGPVFLTAKIVSHKKAKGMYSLLCRLYSTFTVLCVDRGPCGICGQGSRPRCPGYLESTHLTRANTRPVWLLCVPRDPGHG